MRAKLTFISMALAVGALSAAPAHAGKDIPAADTYDANWPVTQDRLDQAFWNVKAAPIFKSCVGKSLDSLAGKTATQLSAARALAKTCMASTLKAAAVTTETICLATTAANCTNLDWYASWCGRAAVTAHGSDAKWVCNTSVASAVSAHETAQGVSQATIHVPEIMRTGSVETRTYLRRGSAFRSKHAPASDVDAYVLPPPPGGSQLTLNPVLTSPSINFWELNGGAVASCDEYAFEKYYDLNQVFAAARSQQNSARYLADRFFKSVNGARPLVTAAGAWDTRDRGGAASPPPSLRDGDPWIFVITSNPLNIRYGTFKNAYYYLNRMLDQSNTGYSGLLHQTVTFASYGGEVEDLQQFYPITPAWHRQMEAALTAAGYLDEELEYLRDKQTELLKTWQDYQDLALAATCHWIIAVNRTICPLDPAAANAARDAKLAEVQSKLAEGYQLGCLGGADNQASPCDWSPSRFADAVAAGHHGRTDAASSACVRVAGPSTFTEANLDGEFPMLSAVTVSIPQADINRLNTLRAGYVANVYSSSTAKMDQFLVDEPSYRHELVATIGRDLASFSLSRSADLQKTVSGDIVGAALISHSSSGLSPASQVPTTAVQKHCGIGSVFSLDEHSRFDASVTVPAIGSSYPLGSWDVIGTGDSINPADSRLKPGLSAPAGVGVGVTFGHHEFFAGQPSRGTQDTASLSITVSSVIQYVLPLVQAGPFYVALYVGGGADASGTLSVSYTSLPVQTRFTDPQCIFRHDSITLSATPSITVRLFVGASLGLGISIPGVGALGISIGIEGGLIPLQLSLPTSWTHSWEEKDDPTLPITSPDARQTVSGTESGSWSSSIQGVFGRFYARLVVKLDLLFISETLFAIDLAYTAGYEWSRTLLSEVEPSTDVCIALEAKYLMQGGTPPPAACRCFLRPMTLPECQ